MIRLGALLLGLLVALGLAVPPAQAQRLVSELSRTLVELSSSFSGDTIAFFGNIETPENGSGALPEDPYNVVIVVTGPTTRRVVRHKSRQFGIWLTTEQVEFENVPTFFHVMSSGRLTNIADPVTLSAEGIVPESQIPYSEEAGWYDSAVFGGELVRLMTRAGLFRVSENAVNFQSDSFYSARLSLPSDVPPGTYLSRTYVFQGGEIIARKAESFAVRKVGFERFLGLLSQQQPLLYGLASVALALFTGWLGGVIFKR